MGPAGPVSRAREPGSPVLVILRAQLHYGAPLFGYVLSLALTAVAGVLSLVRVERETFSFFPFFFFYPAIAVASFLGGAGPGLAAALLGAVFAWLFFPDPPGTQNWISLAIIGPLVVAGFARLRFLRDRNRAIAHEFFNFKLIGDHASDWILLIGESGLIRYVNLRASTDLGWTDRELTGRHIESLVSEAQRPMLSAALERAKLGAGKPIELAFERRDKSLVPMELGCTAVRTGEEQVIHAAARDIGERKRIEKKLQEIRHWESLRALAGGLAHDFNNLLTAILGNASLARNILPPEHETAPMLDAILASADRSSDLVRMLLATAGYRSRDSEALQLDQLLDWTLANRPLPAQVRVAKEAVPAPFRGDRHAFETLLWSLISNAAEAYGEKDGEIRVAIRFGPAPIFKRPARAASFEEGDAGSGECIGIVVEDRGSGMSPEILERAFDPFFSTRFTGRGLGLPAVRGIVRAYRGRLSLETVAGEGTRVEVWLPKN
jgi:PAS domain S-box-containing protein